MSGAHGQGRPTPHSPQPISSPTLNRSAQRVEFSSDSTEAHRSQLARLLAWPRWSLVSHVVAFLGIIASLWQLQAPLQIALLVTLHLCLIGLSQASPVSAQEQGAARVDVHLLVVTLVFMLNTSFVEHALSFAPLGAFAVGAALLLSPPQRHLILMMLIFTLELGWALKYAGSVSEASSHALVYGAGLGLMLWLIKQVKAEAVDELEEARSRHYVSATLYELPSQEEPQRSPSGVRKSLVIEADVTVQELSSPQLLDEPSQADPPAPVDEANARPVTRPPLPHSATPYYGSSVSGEHDLGLATRQVRPFSPPEHLDNIRQHALEQRKRPLEFLDLSCAITLGHLAEQLNADSAVLVWRRNKSGGREAAVRWRWTKRPSDLWRACYFSVERELIREAMATSGVFHLSQADGWDGVLPYYLPEHKVARMLAVPICPYGEGEADGLLMIDRDLDEPWSDTELDASFRLAQKINLDVDISRFMKQLVHNSGLSDALLLGLSNLNESEELGDLSRALLEGVMVHDVCRWIAVCGRVGDQVTLLSTWSKDQLLYLDGERYPLGEDGVSQCLKSGEMIEAGAVVPRDANAARVTQIALEEVFPFSLPALERCASVHIKPLCDPYGVEVHGAIVLGVEHQALLAAPYINPLDLIIEEAAVKMSWLHAHEQLRQLAMFDGLTSLCNHRSFQSELDQILKRARRAERPTALILLDIDHFKSINDSYGHPFGDQVLKGVAGALSDSMREVDLVARYGGEEFAIALEDSSIEDAKIAAERARTAVEDLSFNCKGEDVKVTISLGVALFPSDSTEKAELIDRADQSLYEAKRRGRNQVRIWSESRLDERSPSRMWTRHPVAGSQELRGIDALISPSGDELQADGLFDTSQQRILEERSLRADGRVPSSDVSQEN